MKGGQERIELSKRWKVFQLGAIQIASGATSAYLILRYSEIKALFSRVLTEAGYDLVTAIIVGIGILAVLCSGGIGLVRTISVNKLLRALQKEEEKEDERR